MLELLIAVSIFGVILIMTFSIINYVPKLAKAESSEYSERTYVRRALTEITGTIQSANIVTFPSLVFTMPTGEKISYEYNGGNANKIVDGKAYRLMESVDEFKITAIDNYLFNIHIKTSIEGKEYDFKVERRRGGSIKTDAVISTISPKTEVFDKKTPSDIIITLSLNGNKLTGLRNDLIDLDPNKDYTISENKLTLKGNYLTGQPIGTIKIVFNVTNGLDPELSVEIRDTSTYIKIAGNSYEDDLVRMNYPGDLQIDTEDNKWILTVTNGTVDSSINKDNLTITGLPSGINVTAAKIMDENKIIITLSGTASEPVTNTKQIDIVIKGSGVTEKSALDSEPIKVLLLPGATYASPEHNLIFTNEISFKNTVTITGDIVIGRETDMTTISNNCNFYGYIYVDSSLTTENNTVFGKNDKKTKVFVKGSVNFKNNTYIYGDLYYRDTLQHQNQLYVSGVMERRAVEIPNVTLPTLKSDDWYYENGYTIVDNSNSKVNLQDNGKYLFKTSYEFSNDLLGLDNVTIVGKGDIKFGNNFSGSGIIFAPNGKITIVNNCSFKGMCISKSTELLNNATLEYKRYTELPFNQ